VVGGCASATNEQSSAPGSLQPANLDGAHGYNSAPLLAAGGDGTGENVALVEFSNYNNTDQLTYQSCYGTAVPVHRISIHGGNSSTGGGDEVALDQEVLTGEAPNLDGIFTFVAPGPDTMAGVLDSILGHHGAEHVQIVSDSWGICEAVEPSVDIAATDAELQLLAVAGISFYAASGDSGSSDCARFGINAPEVDDPAVQPYATGVGGTHLNPSSTHNETVWGGHGPVQGGGGGGVSTRFTKPTWQVGAGVIRAGVSSKTRCGGKTHYCREVPDVAFDADPNTGYVIHCTVGQCGTSNAGWQVFGGTSAAAPLMAAFTADANTYSRGHGGKRIGFANPFLYHEFSVDHSMFHDITVGTNNIHGRTTFSAKPGYDVASGLGSVNANEMAIDLGARTRHPVTVDGSVISAGASRNPISAGHPTILTGTLKDHKTHTFLPFRVIWIEGFQAGSTNANRFRVHTGRHGKWGLKLTTKIIKHRFQWHAVYIGEQAHAPAVSPWRKLGVS
jgi:subtilase family serine protease